MSRLNNYLKEMVDKEFDRVRKVPDFKTSAAAQAWVDKLKEFDRVEDDVVDPETGEVLVDKGETKNEAERQKRHVERYNTKYHKIKKVGFGSYLSRAKRRKTDDDELEEPENKENPDAAFNLVLQEVSDYFRKAGEDIAGDLEDTDDFQNSAQEIAGDSAHAIYHNELDPKVKKMFKYLKAKGVNDVEGWIADEIYDGMIGKKIW